MLVCLLVSCHPILVCVLFALATMSTLFTIYLYSAAEQESNFVFSLLSGMNLSQIPHFSKHNHIGTKQFDEI